jgi:hypothetical protein
MPRKRRKLLGSHIVADPEICHGNLRPSNALGYTLTVTPPPRSRLTVGRVSFPNVAGATQQPLGSIGRIRRVQLLLDSYDLAGFNFGLRASSKRNFL